MCSRFLKGAVPALLLLCSAARARSIRVCADPNNLPFSNQAGEGLENKLAELIAAKLGAKLEYVWWSQRKSFVQNSLLAGRCDVIMGLPTSLGSVLATRPYYKSTYVFVSRKDRDLRVSSLADPRFAGWKIGVHVVGDDYAPPAHAFGETRPFRQHRGVQSFWTNLGSRIPRLKSLMRSPTAAWISLSFGDPSPVTLQTGER